jgi:hypothetical protein
VPVAPDVTVRKLALLTAVHAQVEAAVTASVPEVAAPLTLMAALASVTEHAVLVDEGDGEVSLFEHAAAARAREADTAEASNRR